MEKLGIDLIRLEWLDFLWILLAPLIARKGHRVLSLLFIGFCLVMVRLQAELMEWAGFGRGFFGWMQSDVLTRGQITYGIFIEFFLLLAYFSKGADKNVFLAASITILILAFCVTTLVMVL